MARWLLPQPGLQAKPARAAPRHGRRSRRGPSVAGPNLVAVTTGHGCSVVRRLRTAKGETGPRFPHGPERCSTRPNSANIGHPPPEPWRETRGPKKVTTAHTVGPRDVNQRSGHDVQDEPGPAQNHTRALCCRAPFSRPRRGWWPDRKPVTRANVLRMAWSWGESNPRPSGGNRSRYDRSRLRG
jgi:hypothetical protein